MAVCTACVDLQNYQAHITAIGRNSSEWEWAAT
jgi:hypothetical protein